MDLLTVDGRWRNLICPHQRNRFNSRRTEKRIQDTKLSIHIYPQHISTKGLLPLGDLDIKEKNMIKILVNKCKTCMPDQQQQKNNNIMCKKNAFTILTRKKNQSQVIRQSIMFFNVENTQY